MSVGRRAPVRLLRPRGARGRERARSLGVGLAMATVIALASWPRLAHGAPEAHILRIDPRASMTEGAPILTTVIELVQNKRMSEITSRCAMLTGDAQLDCLANLLEQPEALYTPFELPVANAWMTVTVDGADLPATLVSSARWGASRTTPGVGTAWLLLVDASNSMSTRFREAQAVARAFIDAMGPNDVVDVMFFDDRAVVSDSRWLSDSAQARSFVDAASRTYPSQGRTRPLFAIVKTAATDAFKELGNVGVGIDVPLHQAMVVLSSGWAGADTSSLGPGALALSQYMTRGRFPEDNATLPKTPVPVVSIWFPSRQIEEFYQSSRQFMENLANPTIGGFHSIVREGQTARAARIVQAVRTRFDQMHLVRWRVSCVAPTIEQTFKLVFRATDPPIAGDAFTNVPVGIDPTLWPLDVDVARTTAHAKKHRVFPGGSVKIFGSFCWGPHYERAQLYLVPRGQQLPASLGARDVAQAKEAQRKLTESNLVGKATDGGDTYVEFDVPSSAKFLSGKGSKMVARMVVYDSRAHRASAVSAGSVLTLAAREKPLDLWLVGGLTFGGVVLLLLVIPLMRGGAKRAARSPARPAPVVAGHAGAAPVPVGPAGAVELPWPGPAPAGPPLAGAGAVGSGSLGQPAGADPELAAPEGGHGARAPIVPAPPPPAVTRALLTGGTGIYPVASDVQVRVGRDPGISDICLTEPRVSAQHAVLQLVGGQLLVRDEGSNNGTFVAGARIASGVWTSVPVGAQLKFGPVEFVVRLE